MSAPLTVSALPEGLRLTESDNLWGDVNGAGGELAVS
jgi:hypothetical protein